MRERARVTIVDGRSGAGKTTYAERLARETGAQILRLDWLYPGWDGLASGSRSVARALRTGGFERYDWERGVFDEHIELDPGAPLVIEGCGSLTRENLAAARAWAGGVPDRARRVHTVWMECSAGLRRERALARDGEMFRPYWESWATQEEAFFAVAHPISLAIEIVHAD